MQSFKKPEKNRKNGQTAKTITDSDSAGPIQHETLEKFENQKHFSLRSQ